MKFSGYVLSASFAAMLAAVSGFSPLLPAQVTKPSITLDEFLNTTEIDDIRIAPDGTAAVFGTTSPDWKASTYRHTLWLWTATGGLRALTQSGTDEGAEWSPDGKWIAFLSDRPLPGAGDSSAAEPDSGDARPHGIPVASRTGDAGDDKATRLWLISLSGGEAQPLYREKLDVHAFAWSADGKNIDFSTSRPLSTEAQDAQKEEWKDVVRWREQGRGDLLVSLPVEAALANASAQTSPHDAKTSEKKSAKAKSTEAKKEDLKALLPAGAKILSESKLNIFQIAPSLDGRTLAFLTASISNRMENPAATEIFLVPASGGETRQLTHNQALESNLHWSSKDNLLYFAVHAAAGSLEGKYQDVQGRLYRMATDQPESKIERLGAEFQGTFEDVASLPDGRQIALGLKGTEQQIYLVEGAHATKLPGQVGSYGAISVPRSGGSLLVRLSSINHPSQVYLASDALHPDQLTALTDLNPIFAKRAQPDWQPYNWKSKDGVSVEGVLIFPPGKKNAKHLRMLTLIHGGPADADGNRFGADWYDWATMAASEGWLVFRPNYRGSTGYGDEFMLQIAPHLVSKPGEDILAGVDALVKDGYADPNKLAIGGYSYGGYIQP